ncbi:MAG: FmdB family transcriptional regulator [Candidatus Aminicenantes bacterium RBG_16_63_14]|nr:MAG: FmdB family transcriptional regulator [Candidatus Aminicenantes bacterium RBG_16_63_14]OGD25268.1 MAG: FmdB family transcriptional regulator [Candidatus Aminicenantes bacterium RBG_19FT_COMBO_65_30]
MPVYEYRCADCRKKTTVVTLSVKTAVDPACMHCGGRNMAKLVSRVAVRRSEESRLESLADPASLAGLDESDPKSVARWMKKMGREMGEEAGEDFDEEVDKAMEEAASGEGAEGSGTSGDDEDV